MSKPVVACIAGQTALRIGLPRCLNMWATGPLWRTYFETLGIPARNLVWSDETTEEMFAEGGKYGSIDPCYPAKVTQAHIHNLLFHHHSEEKPLDYIYFPSITTITSYLDGVSDSACCPVVTGTPNVMKAAFTKEVDFFAARGIHYLDDAATMSEPVLFKQQLFNCWGERLGVTEDESNFAVEQGWKALDAFDQDLQARGRAILEEVEQQGRMCILLLARPYHLDPGQNHDITEEFQALGYPVLSMRSIPKDPEWLHRFFREDLERGLISSPLEIGDVLPENHSANSAQKVWAAKFGSRHPNVALLDLSSFKCGHDAPTYGIIDGIVSTAKTPYSALHDIDANKPSGSIKIRIKTYAYTLSLHNDRLADLAAKRSELEQRVAEKRQELIEKEKEKMQQALSADPEARKMKDEMEAAYLTYLEENAVMPVLNEANTTTERENENILRILP